MPSFGNDSLAEGIVQVGSTGATGPVTYVAANTDIVICHADVQPIVVQLPSLSVFPLEAVQPPVGPLTPLGATGSAVSGVYSPPAHPGAPSAPNADSFCITVRKIAGGSGAVTVKTTDGALIDGASGGTGLVEATAETGYKFVSKGGNWFTV